MNRYKLHEPRPVIRYSLAIGSLVKIDPVIAEIWQDLKSVYERPYSSYRGVITKIEDYKASVRWEHDTIYDAADTSRVYHLKDLVPQ